MATQNNPWNSGGYTPSSRTGRTPVDSRYRDHVPVPVAEPEPVAPLPATPSGLNITKVKGEVVRRKLAQKIKPKLKMNEYMTALADLKVFQWLQVEVGDRQIANLRMAFWGAADKLGICVSGKISPDHTVLFIRREPNGSRRPYGPRNKSCVEQAGESL